MTSPTRILMTPRNPWSFFLNFFWSKTCTARILSSLALLLVVSCAVQSEPSKMGAAYKSKLSFQYGFKVRLETCVVLVCSPLMVATANGSGNPAEAPSAPGLSSGKTPSRTKNISLV